MTAIGCAEFESALAGLLADPQRAPRDRWDALARHAASCDACRGALDLLELAREPGELRDPIPDPGPEYWRQFETRLAARIAATPRGSVRRRGAVWGAAAALVAVAAGFALVLLVPRRAPSVPEIAVVPPSRAVSPQPSTPTPAAHAAPEAPRAPAGEDLAGGSVRSATPEPSPALDADLVEEDDPSGAFAMGARPDPFADADEAGLFPPVDDLTDEQRARFADWLAQEEARVRRGAA